MILMKTIATDLLPYLHETEGRSVPELMVMTGLRHHIVMKRLQHLIAEGAVVSLGKETEKIGAGPRAHRYRKMAGIEIATGEDYQVAPWVLEAVHTVVRCKRLTLTGIGVSTRLSHEQLRSAVDQLIVLGKIERVGCGEYAACGELAKAESIIKPWDYMNYRTEHSPDWKSMNATSTYKALPKDIDL